MPQMQNQQMPPKQEAGGIVRLNPKKNKKKKGGDNSQQPTFGQQPVQPTYQQPQYYQPQQPVPQKKIITNPNSIKASGNQNKKVSSGNQKPQVHSAVVGKKTDSGSHKKKTESNSSVEKAKKDLDKLEVPKRDDQGPVRLPILDRYRENSLYIMGKLENGTLKYGETYTLMPSKAKVEIGWLFDTEERGVPYARPGESVRIRCKGIENESDVARGNILCSNDDLCAVFNTFEAEIQVLELQEQQIITNGFKCILHFHTNIEGCSLDIKCEIDRANKTEKKVKFVRSQARIKAYVKTTNPVCGEKYEKYPSLGIFSMRYEGQTIAIGKVLKYKPYTK